MLQIYNALKSYMHLKVAAWGDLQGSLYWSCFSSLLCAPHLIVTPEGLGPVIKFLILIVQPDTHLLYVIDLATDIGNICSGQLYI